MKTYTCVQHWSGEPVVREAVSGASLYFALSNVLESADEPESATTDFRVRMTHTKYVTLITCDEAPGMCWMVTPSVIEV